MAKSRNYTTLPNASPEVDQTRSPAAGQARNYEALRETQRDADATPAPGSRQSRNYEELRETQQRVDQSPEPPDTRRTWTHLGGMVPHHASANRWHKQNEHLMSERHHGGGSGREGQGAQTSQPSRDQNDPELQQARAAVEEARLRETAERARLQERERGGPER